MAAAAVSLMLCEVFIIHPLENKKQCKLTGLMQRLCQLTKTLIPEYFQQHKIC
jgi:hypothetical protein